MAEFPVLLHVDADAFFASVVLRSRPEIVARPVAAVAHVFIASANYPARDRGVRGGMPVPEALRLCPDLVLVDVPRAEVEEVGDAMFDIFHEVARAVEPGSIEEAFLDVGARDWGAAVQAGRILRERVQRELGIAVSVGVGRTKLMAKLASRAAKPDGLYVMDAAQEARLRTTLPMTEVWGIGPTTLHKLSTLGVAKLGDLDRIPADQLMRVCGTTMARKLSRIRSGTDDAVVHSVERRTALTAEGSIAGFERPDKTPTELMEACLERLCRRAARAGLAGTGITLALRPESGDAPIVLKQNRLVATAEPETWLPIARELLGREWVPRLDGMRVSLTGLIPLERVQQTLF